MATEVTGLVMEAMLKMPLAGMGRSCPTSSLPAAHETVAGLEARYAGAGYGDFKRDLAEVVVDAFAPIRERTAI